MRDVPHTEAVAILRGMLDNPGMVRAVKVVDDGSYGPLPFFFDGSAGEAEVTLQYCGGVVHEVASIRIGSRFTNAHGWGDNPWDDLKGSEVDVLEAALRRSALDLR